MPDLSPATLEKHREEYVERGFTAVADLFGRDDVANLRTEAVRICRGEAGVVFGALDVEAARDMDDDRVLSQYLAIHFPHKISALMLEAMKHPSVVELLKVLVGPNVKSMQSMLFLKRAGKPGQAWHQDEYYIPTRDRSLVGVWIALDDADIENGAMWMLPGSHSAGVIYPTHQHGDARFDPAEEARDFPMKEADAVSLEVSAGSVVFFDGYVLHRSLPNTRKTGFRRALVNHYMSAESLLPWGFGGPHVDMRDIVMICGDDPYAWKGTEEITRPFCRAEHPEQRRALREQLRSSSG